MTEEQLWEEIQLLRDILVEKDKVIQHQNVTIDQIMVEKDWYKRFYLETRDRNDSGS